MNVKNIKISTILLGIILTITGFFFLKNPTSSFIAMSKVLGVASIIKGIMLIVMFFKVREYFSIRAGTTLAAGILLIIFGGLFIYKPSVFAAIITYLLSIWFIMLSILGFNFSVFYKYNKALYILNIVLNILLIIGGVLILFNPSSVAISMSLLIGLLLIVDGISSVIWSLSIKVID